MATVLLIIHLFVTLALIGVVLIQRSEGGGLGIGTSQGMGSFMSGRGTANLLTRTTAILGAIFFGLSLTLAQRRVLLDGEVPDGAVKLLTFFTSALVPYCFAPFSITLTLASQRRLPSSILQSLTPQ